MSRADGTAIAAQADIDTPETVPSYGVPVETENVGLNRNTIDINETLGCRGPTTSEYGFRFAEGSINGAARPVSLPCSSQASSGRRLRLLWRPRPSGLTPSIPWRWTIRCRLPSGV